VRGITIWQPWATLVARGVKKIETRSWGTTHRGPLAIHSAKRWSPLQSAAYQRFVDLGLYSLDDMETPLTVGKILAVAVLLDVVPVGSIKPGTQERALGDYSAGRFAWMLGDVRELSEPLAYTGSQTFFTVPDKMILSRC
jgi:hypothetical protein